LQAADEAPETWLFGQGRYSPDLVTLLDGFAERLLSAGFPLHAIGVHLRILHPLYQGLSYRWTSERRTVEATHRHDEQPRWDFDGSLAGAVASDAAEAELIEVRAAETAWHERYPAHRADVEGGAVHALAIRLPYSTGRRNALVVMGRHPGFSPEQVERLKGLARLISPFFELHAYKGLAARLVNTYVGSQAGARVLQGLIKRGEGTTLRAVIWFSDIRGFTSLSNVLDRSELLELLNVFFDAIASAVRSEGGEILKFMGDAVMAVFASNGEEPEPQVILRAVAAARRSLEEIATANETRTARGHRPIRFGVALHIGDVIYGNIGAEDRLDFTVLGPAVNVASRLSALCGQLDEPILVSEELARLGAIPGRDLGPREIRGVGSLGVFAPEL
jgi:adenylate cyclase